MPECTSTGCRRERFAFVALFSQSALYDGCVVFFGPCSALFKRFPTMSAWASSRIRAKCTSICSLPLRETGRQL